MNPIVIPVPSLPTSCEGLTVRFCPRTGALKSFEGKMPRSGLARRIIQRVQNGAGYYGFTSLSFGRDNVSISLRGGLRGTHPEAFLREAIGSRSTR